MVRFSAMSMVDRILFKGCTELWDGNHNSYQFSHVNITTKWLADDTFKGIFFTQKDILLKMFLKLFPTGPIRQQKENWFR